jgi:hypothetical protein
MTIALLLEQTVDAAERQNETVQQAAADLT